MATAHVTFCQQNGPGPVCFGPDANLASETIAQNTSGSETCPFQTGGIAIINAIGGAIYVAAGTAPDSSSAPRFYVAQYEKFPLAVRYGDKIDITDA